MSILTEPYMMARKNNGVLFEPDSNCVLWLPGQDDAQSSVIRDRSGNGYDGTIYGATWTRLDSGLWSLSYTGDDYVDCGASANLNFTTSAFTIFAWVYPTNLTADNIIICRGINTTDGWYCAVMADGRLHIRTNQASAAQETYSTASDIVVSNWYFLGMTRSGATCKVFKNVSGVITDITATSATHINPLTSARTTKVGRYDSATAYFIGKMALVGVESAALTTTQLQGIFDQTRHLFRV